MEGGVDRENGSAGVGSNCGGVCDELARNAGFCRAVVGCGLGEFGFDEELPQVWRFSESCEWWFGEDIAQKWVLRE